MRAQMIEKRLKMVEEKLLTAKDDEKAMLLKQKEGLEKFKTRLEEMSDKRPKKK